MALAVAAALTAVGCRGFTALVKPAAPLHIDNIHSRIKFNLWQIDSWENESFEVYINDELVFTSPAVFRHSSLVNAPYTGSTQINGQTVVFTMSHATNTEDGSGGSGNDQMFDVSIDLPKGFGENVSLKVGSTLDGPISDESWALDNLKLLQGFEDAGALDRFGAGLSDEVETASYASLVEYGSDGTGSQHPACSRLRASADPPIW